MHIFPHILGQDQCVLYCTVLLCIILLCICTANIAVVNMYCTAVTFTIYVAYFYYLVLFIHTRRAITISIQNEYCIVLNGIHAGNHSYSIEQYAVGQVHTCSGRSKQYVFVINKGTRN
jgi:hypothetical protein